jgi:hypothetical protein
VALPSERPVLPQEPAHAPQPSIFSRVASVGSSTSASKAAISIPDAKVIKLEPEEIAAPGTTTNTVTRNLDTTSNTEQSPNQPGIHSIPEEGSNRNITTKTGTPEACTCGCHNPPLPQTKRPTYTNASVQTDPMPPQPRTSLRVDTLSASAWSNHSYSAVSRDVRTPVFDNFGVAPFSMGRMTNYFSKPGYQLGDSLSSGYHYYEQPVYQYQEEFGDEALR